MKLNPAHTADFRKALEAVDASAFGLIDVEVYPGATIYSRRSIVALTFDTATEAALADAAEHAARLAEARLGIALGSGVRNGADQPLVLWLEYFPGGANYASARFALAALQAGFVAAAAAKSGKAADKQAAERAAAALAKAPVQDIFVQSRFLIAAARAADIPVHNVAASNVAWQFGWGTRSEQFFMTASSADSVPGHQITWRKHIAKKLFREIGLPTPDWRLVTPDGDQLRAANEIGWPCVVKPVDRSFGTGVAAGIADAAQLQAAVAIARRLSRNILIEAHEAGDDYRLMVVDGRLVAAVRRNPPAITGDGKRTVAQLIAELNKGRDGSRQASYLLPVERDAALDATLAKAELSMESVLAKGQRLTLRSVANFSTGGSATEVTAKVHPQIRGLAELLAAAVGLRTAGIDYVTTDITRSHAEVGGGFIEVNAMPRLRVLMNEVHPEEEIGALMLGQSPGRIPVTLIAGDSDALVEIAGPLRAQLGSRPGTGAVSSQWAQVGATLLPAAGLDAFALVEALLRNKAVEEMLILWSPAELTTFGVPADRLVRAIVIGDAEAPACLPEICGDVVRVADTKAVMAAAFGGC